MKQAIALLGMMGLLAAGPVLWAGEDEEFTDDFPLEECQFSDTGRNPYFSLEPGDQLILEGEDDGETLRVQITVLQARRWITFPIPGGGTRSVRTRVVEEREWVDDELIEVSRNYFARCKQTNDVYYFGEEVDIYKNGRIVSHAGAWRAGPRARPGIIMPGTFLLGSRYYQELAPNVALDRAEHTAMGLLVDVPAGVFDDCVEVTETTPLEPGHESTKVYCPGIGLVIDSEAELAEFDIAGDDDDED